MGAKADYSWLYIYMPAVKMTYCRVRKCGGTAINNALINAGGCLVNEPRGTTIGMWRDPWKRFESTYRCFTELQRNKKPFEEWAEHMLTFDFPSDPHLTPQVDSGNLTDVRIPWDFDAFAKHLQVESIPVMNASKAVKLEWNPHISYLFYYTYKADIREWRKLSPESFS